MLSTQLHNPAAAEFCAERSEARRIFNEARANQTKRAKRIEWNNVSLVVDVAIMSVAISRDPSLEYSRLPQGSLASLTHLLLNDFNLEVLHL